MVKKLAEYVYNVYIREAKLFFQFSKKFSSLYKKIQPFPGKYFYVGEKLNTIILMKNEKPNNYYEFCFVQ